MSFVESPEARGSEASILLASPVMATEPTTPIPCPESKPKSRHKLLHNPRPICDISELSTHPPKFDPSFHERRVRRREAGQSGGFFRIVSSLSHLPVIEYASQPFKSKLENKEKAETQVNSPASFKENKDDTFEHREISPQSNVSNPVTLPDTAFADYGLCTGLDIEKADLPSRTVTVAKLRYLDEPDNTDGFIPCHKAMRQTRNFRGLHVDTEKANSFRYIKTPLDPIPNESSPIVRYDNIRATDPEGEYVRQYGISQSSLTCEDAFADEYNKNEMYSPTADIEKLLLSPPDQVFPEHSYSEDYSASSQCDYERGKSNIVPFNEMKNGKSNPRDYGYKVASSSTATELAHQSSIISDTNNGSGPIRRVRPVFHEKKSFSKVEIENAVECLSEPTMYARTLSNLVDHASHSDFATETAKVHEIPALPASPSTSVTSSTIDREFAKFEIKSIQFLQGLDQCVNADEGSSISDDVGPFVTGANVLDDPFFDHI